MGAFQVQQLSTMQVLPRGTFSEVRSIHEGTCYDAAAVAPQLAHIGTVDRSYVQVMTKVVPAGGTYYDSTVISSGYTRCLVW